MKVIHSTYFKVLVLSCAMTTAYADTIKVHNETDTNLFAGIYYYQYGQPAKLATEITVISPRESVDMSRPDRKLYRKFPPSWFDRQLVFSSDPAKLRDPLTEAEYNQVTSTNVGSKWGSTFHIAPKEGKLVGFNMAEWEVQRPLVMAAKKAGKAIGEAFKPLTDAMRNMIRNKQSAVQENPYKDKVATVRVGTELSEGERAYLALRALKVKAALQTFLGKSLEGKYIPKIAMICSGGGYRAMTSTLGAYIGAHEIGLVDALTWAVGLSGSTWFLNLLMANGVSPQELRKQLAPKMGKGLEEITADEMKLVLDALLVKYSFDQPITLVDIYAGLLANHLLDNFGDKRHMVYLSQQIDRVKDANVPFPIYTAIRSGKGLATAWAEYSPYEIYLLGTAVPSWSFGRKFANGISTDFAPELSLGFHMGTFGSAFAATFDQMTANMMKKTDFGPFEVIVEELLHSIGQKRLTWAEVNNFAAGIAGSELKDFEHLKLVDAGLDYNLPYPPVSGERSERKADILLFSDASATRIQSPALKGAQEYAKRKGLKFPTIDYTGIETRAISIFKDENDPDCPVVIYMPLINEPALVELYKKVPGFENIIQQVDGFDPNNCIKASFCNTNNFKYTVPQVIQLSSQMEFNMRASEKRLIDAISWVIDMKSPKEEKEEVAAAAAAA